LDSAVCPELPGGASAEDTEPEAGRDIEDAIRLDLAPFKLDFRDRAKVVAEMVG
jgi:hypothetical protein